jgi:hypothetical protein
MKKNMGGTDRIIRIAVAIIALGLYFTNILTGSIGLLALVISGIFVVTSLGSFCPLYSIFGLSTCKVKEY